MFCFLSLVVASSVFFVAVVYSFGVLWVDLLFVHLLCCFLDFCVCSFAWFFGFERFAFTLFLACFPQTNDCWGSLLGKRLATVSGRAPEPCVRVLSSYCPLAALANPRLVLVPCLRYPVLLSLSSPPWEGHIQACLSCLSTLWPVYHPLVQALSRIPFLHCLVQVVPVSFRVAVNATVILRFDFDIISKFSHDIHPLVFAHVTRESRTTVFNCF